MMEWCWIVMMVAAIPMVLYLVWVFLTPSKAKLSKTEQVLTVKETAETVLALVDTVERLDSEVQELKKLGGRKT